MSSAEYERDQSREQRERAPQPSKESEPAQELSWASTIGNAGVQRIARSPAGRRAPVGSEALPLATGVLARQAEEEEEAGGGQATAEAEPAAEGGEAAGVPAAEGAEEAAPAAEAGGAVEGAEEAAPAAEVAGAGPEEEEMTG